MESITAQLLFFDHDEMRAAGLVGELPAHMAFNRSCVPQVGDIIRFPQLTFAPDLAFFRVDQRAFLAGQLNLVQLSLTLLATRSHTAAEESTPG